MGDNDNLRLVTPSTIDQGRAEAAIAWALAQNAENDFIHNIKVIAKSGVVDHRTQGYAAAIVKCWDKEITTVKIAALLKPVAERKHVGVVGERSNLTLISEPQGFDSQYGTNFLHRFATEDGNLCVWWTGSNDTFQVNKMVTVKATVKVEK